MTLPNPSRATFPGAIDLDLTERLEHEDWLRQQRMSAASRASSQPAETGPQAFDRLRAASPVRSPARARFGSRVLMAMHKRAKALGLIPGVRRDGE